MRLSSLKLFIKDHLLAVASFLLIFGITVFFFLDMKKRVQESNRQEFEFRTFQAKTALERRIQHYVQVLQGAQGFFYASDSVTRADWATYVNSLKVDKFYPGIQGTGYTMVLQPEELQAHEQLIRSEGYSDYTVFPEGQRPVYTSIVYLEPFTERNLRAFGYDMFSEPIRRKAMIQARDSGAPAITGKVILKQETSKNVQPGFLIYLPVYKTKSDPKTLENRRKLIKGYVYNPFRAKDLMNAVLGKEFTDLDIEVYDGETIEPEALLFDQNTDRSFFDKKKPVFSKKIEMQLYGHKWNLYFSTLNGIGSLTETVLPYLILFGGTIISLLIFSIIRSLSSTRKSNQLKQTITDNATAALFMMDPQGYCTFMNPAAEEMTGYTFAEVKNKPLHNVIHHSYPDGRPYPISECPIDRALPTNKIVREHQDVFIHKNGTFFDVQCAARPIYENDKTVGTLVEVRDISQEKRAQRALIESEQRFRNMADSAPVAIWLTGETKQCIYVNKQWLQFTGQRF
ncbi:MAG: CHASE domain-containing protein, partial [Hymenobacteraceae bacterium]|nr:CHASE domain-containing protein [Hymenobacteraceae bacterium]MDX5397357.1 CHASE domain-containing protein [Hymenobacteraceae bacterium]MDX5443902.1 CHASE domain-containing protein [Hymenobacteraceae bacterium]MDX5513437.1 CHASE domain-containing protein [Hymenobacteraceae bacterium]